MNKRNRFNVAFVLAICVGVIGIPAPSQEKGVEEPVLEQVFELTEDNILSGFQRIDGVYYFVGRTPEFGWELWTTDLTPEGTQMVKDICPGTCSSVSRPVALVPLGGKIYFTAVHPDFGMEIWTTDGTEDGTQLAMEVFPGPSGFDYPWNATVQQFLVRDSTDGDSHYGETLWAAGNGGRWWVVGNTIFFTTDNSTEAKKLWSFTVPGPPEPVKAGVGGGAWLFGGAVCLVLSYVGRQASEGRRRRTV